MNISIDNNYKTESKTKTVKHPILSSTESKQLYEAGKKDKYCAVCVKTFYSAEKLRQHIEAIHEGLKHKCPHCYEEFSYKKFELSLHQKLRQIFTTSSKILLKTLSLDYLIYPYFAILFTYGMPPKFRLYGSGRVGKTCK